MVPLILGTRSAQKECGMPSLGRIAPLQIKLSCAPSAREFPDIARHAAFRLVEHALKSKSGFFRQPERCSVCGNNPQDHLAGVRCRSQVLIYKVDSSQSQAFSSPLGKDSIRNIDFTGADKP